MRLNVVITTFLSGSKGGVGKSTIVASLPYVIDAPMILIDFGIDGSYTCMHIHKLPTPPSDGLIDYLIFNRKFDLREYASKDVRNCYVAPGVSSKIPAHKISFLTEEYEHVLEQRFNEFLEWCLDLGVNIVLIDLPANPKILGLVYPLMLYYSNIVNFIVDTTALKDSLAALDSWYYEMIDLGLLTRAKIINVIANKLVTKNIDRDLYNTLKKYCIGSDVHTIPFDVCLAIGKAHPLACSQFKRALVKYAEVLKRQIEKYAASKRAF